MKNNKKKLLIIILFLLLITTGCTKTLTDSNKKAVRNNETGQTLTKNILCKPTNNKTASIYKKNNCFYSYFISICFISFLSSLVSFLGISIFSIPFLNSALISSSVISSPT